MGEFDADLALFGEFLADAQALKSPSGKRTYYATWLAHNPGEAAMWAAFRDAVLAGDKPVAPVLESRFGQSLVHAGEMGMSISHLVGALVDPNRPPPPPPPPAPGVEYPASYYTGPLGTSNILPPQEGAFLMTWANEPGGGTEDHKNFILSREAAMGRTYDGIMFPEPQFAETVSWIAGKGAIPIVAGKNYGSVASVAAGSADAAIQADADVYASYGVQLIMRLMHEMEASHVVYTCNGNEANFVLAWRRIVEIYQARGASNVGFWFCPGEGGDNDGDRESVDLSYPGDAYVDWSGSDAYNWVRHNEDLYANPWQSGWADFNDILDYDEGMGGDGYEIVPRHTTYGPSKPFMIGETNCTYDNQPGFETTKGQWYRDVVGHAQNMEWLRGIAFFDVDASAESGGGAYPERNNWLVDRLASIPEVLAGYVAMAQDSWFNTRM